MKLCCFCPAILTLTCKPALAERETALAFALPESLPALPPAYNNKRTPFAIKLHFIFHSYCVITTPTIQCTYLHYKTMYTVN